MTAVLKIKGETYRSVDDVEKAVRKLAADISLLPEDSDKRALIAEHVGELLAAIPDERASALLQLIAGGNDVDVASLDDAEREDLDAAVRNEDAERYDDEPPLCPMCQGHGVLGAEPPQDPTAERCPACDGFGTVYTGSRVEGHTTRHCPTCSGNGYITKVSDIPLPPPATRAVAAPAWIGAVWNPTTQQWDPPEGEKPWADATWNHIEGTYR